MLELWFLSNFLWFCNNIAKIFVEDYYIFVLLSFSPQNRSFEFAFLCLLLFYVLFFVAFSNYARILRKRSHSISVMDETTERLSPKPRREFKVKVMHLL